MTAQRPAPIDDSRSTPTHVVVMGVSGSGKSTVAVALAHRLGWEVAEGDEFHPPENVAKMATGRPLTDEDRWPWLQRLAEWLADHDAAGRSTVLACSALRRSYRDVLSSGGARVRFLHLTGPEAVLAERMGVRDGHFMPGSLLRSQLETLEPLQADEAGLVLDVRDDPDALVDAAFAWVR